MIVLPLGEVSSYVLFNIHLVCAGPIYLHSHRKTHVGPTCVFSAKTVDQQLPKCNYSHYSF